MPEEKEKILRKATQRARLVGKIQERAKKSPPATPSQQKLAQFQVLKQKINRDVANFRKVLRRRNLGQKKKIATRMTGATVQFERKVIRGEVAQRLKHLRKTTIGPGKRLAQSVVRKATSLLRRVNVATGSFPKKLIGGLTIVPERTIGMLRREAQKKGQLKGGKPQT